MPKVSIIMNCFNGEKYLKEAIDSIFAQTFEDWEFIFWDNASTDRSAEIARSYGDKVRYFRAEETTSLGTARALALKLAKGEWIGFLDADDYWLPQKLEKQLEALGRDDYIFCYGGIKEITEQGKVIRTMNPLCQSGMTLPYQLRQFDVNMVTPLMNRQFLIDNDFSFNPIITASAEYSLFMRMAVKGKFCVIHEVLGAWRIWPGTLTSRQQYKLAEERRITLDQIKVENPRIEDKYPGAFAEAYARGDYYEACYLVVEGRISEAKVIMKRIKPFDRRYGVLYILLFVPGLWQLAHSNFLKLTVMNGLSNMKRRLMGTFYKTE